MSLLEVFDFLVRLVTLIIELFSFFLFIYFTLKKISRYLIYKIDSINMTDNLNIEPILTTDQVETIAYPAVPELNANHIRDVHLSRIHDKEKKKFMTYGDVIKKIDKASKSGKNKIVVPKKKMTPELILKIANNGFEIYTYVPNTCFYFGDKKWKIRWTRKKQNVEE